MRNEDRKVIGEEMRCWKCCRFHVRQTYLMECFDKEE